MNILNCLTVDDEPHALELLEAYIEKVPFLQLKKQTTSPWEAVEELRAGGVDLLFLDIQMDEITGLQLLDICEHTCPVIITSAYSEYALDGYQYEVSDYLLKPFSFDRFLKAVNKVSRSLAEKKIPDSNPTIVSDALFVKGDAKNKFHRLKIPDILYIEGLKNYVQFYLKNEKIITLMNIKDLEERLPALSFCRVHRSYIVNINQISKVDGNTLYIEDKMIPVGQSYRKAFLERINNEQI